MWYIWSHLSNNRSSFSLRVEESSICRLINVQEWIFGPIFLIELVIKLVLAWVPSRKEHLMLERVCGSKWRPATSFDLWCMPSIKSRSTHSFSYSIKFISSRSPGWNESGVLPWHLEHLWCGHSISAARFMMWSCEACVRSISLRLLPGW